MKRLHLTIVCLAAYDSGIEVPDEMTIDEAIEYAKQHLDEVPLGSLQYIKGSDEIDEENCDFEESQESHH